MPAFFSLSLNFLLLLFCFVLNWQWNIKRNQQFISNFFVCEQRLCASLWFLYILLNQFVFLFLSFFLFHPFQNGCDAVKWPMRDEKPSNTQCTKMWNIQTTTMRRREEEAVQTHTMWIMIAHHSMFYDFVYFHTFFLGSQPKDNAWGRKGAGLRIKRHNTLLLQPTNQRTFDRIHTVCWVSEMWSAKTAREILFGIQQLSS